MLVTVPTRIPAFWFKSLYQMALMRGYTEATVAAARSTITLTGQRNSVLLLDDLPRLEMPTLLIWGANDRILPYSQAEIAAKRLRDGQLVRIPECGHVAHVECAEQVGEALRAFLGSTV